jgi:lysophospholipase L1-like esterase
MPYSESVRLFRQLRVLALVCLITVSLFVIAEAGLRYFAPQIQQRISWNGVKATASDHDLHYVLAPNYHAVMHAAEFNPRFVEYKTSAQGFRDDRIYDEHKSPGTIRILILGDSFAYGAASNYSEMWPVVFEKQLAKLGYKVEVIKAGVMGYDTRQEIIYLKRLFPTYKPNIVVLAFLLNDLFTNRPLAAESRTGPEEVSRERATLTAQKVDNLHLVTLAKRLLLKSDALYTSIYLGTQRATFLNPHSPVLQRQLETTKGLLLEGGSYAAHNPL